MKIWNVPQYSAEWWTLRSGLPTASEFDKILTPVKRQKSSCQSDYIRTLIDELNNPDMPFGREGRPMTAAMAHGTNCEPEARAFYAFISSEAVREVGFVEHDSGMFGCSPDGLVKGKGLELKCPQGNTQMKYLDSEELPSEYKCQVHGCMIVTGCKSWDFLSYAENYDPVLITVERDDFTDALEEELGRFLLEYNEQSKRHLKMPFLEAVQEFRKGGMIDEVSLSMVVPEL